MNYEIESALSRKADNWKVEELMSKMFRVEQENANLKELLHHEQNSNRNHSQALERIIQIMTESGKFENDESVLCDIRQYIF